ncbi:16S rRNA (cytidine(1402)-2'-O)-methyltransferase [Caldanaerobius polysaccharolyticus]|uniref:16S rRNA (cytidine(1402)-2'-O)-methyltransferase n=1 Tax=Caldanaerobius polysaccharolyticus TaxID=44256 RepID=UPI0004791C76|nr:16S rRNA (cytidine(1402)-2'-O)-methyltransferase [Caldanaerobius polysaccharolyticus]
MANWGILYLCPTPIGNMEDITLRTLNVLKTVDVIAAEDTRHTIKLLNHYGISKPLISYHEHNEKSRSQEIIKTLKNGKSVALVSDAGMPLISDPGQELVKLAIDEGIKVVPLPGPSAALTALIASGIATRRFCFEGFLPENKKERQKILEELKSERRTIIIYESPHHLAKTLRDLFSSLGNRKITVARELTKIHEEFFHADLRSALEHFSQEVKGEFVLVLDGNQEPAQENWNNLSILDHINLYMSSGMSKMEAIKNVARDRNMPKSEVYKHAIDK